ncbi:unnamed protein product [Hermetia illucens]|uniref:Odorant receptor n=1 Tax=Hermetia illucens TaxID=343691 RepID=A0A7R8UU35_HERIL|nr:unnamed protein product [Hermetia illucens]
MKRVDFVASAQFNIKLLHFFGVWVTPDSSLLYRIYAFFMQILIGYTFMLNVCLILPTQHDLEGFMLSLPISLTMAGFVIKLANLYVRRYQIKDFFTLLNSNESQVYGEEELDIILRANEVAKKLIYIWFGIFLTAGLTALSPMISFDPKVPYPIFYPDWREGPKMFYISCGYQLICVFSASLSNGAIDAFISYFLVVLGGLIDALRWKLSTLKKTEKMDDAMARREYLGCISRHKHLLRLASELQSVFSTVTFAQIFLSSVIVCGLLFQLSLLSPLQDPKLFFKLLSFASAIFIQIFIPCYTANEVRIKTEELKLSTYSSEWSEMPQDTKKMIIIFMQRLQHPILITVGGILFLGMENFMVVRR